MSVSVQLKLINTEHSRAEQSKDHNKATANSNATQSVDMLH